ncbi:hypothetical protein URH17368_1461 [Alicyclobacillus hesperidum URH17-3-68]|nr:hypothetical protein URH17368_1461 [Alicyclobacillus hesperidum URH17-3-68]
MELVQSSMVALGSRLSMQLSSVPPKLLPTVVTNNQQVR